MKNQAAIQEIIKVLQLLSIENLQKVYTYAATMRDLQ